MGAGYIAYMSVDNVTFRIEGTTHCGMRADERDCVSGDFIVGRLETLFGREEFVDAILNGIRMGETFIIEDISMGIDIVVNYNYDKSSSMDVLTAITTRCNLRFGNGQKILTVLKDGVSLGRWNNSTKKVEVFAW